MRLAHSDPSNQELLTTVRNYADHAHGEQTRKYTPEPYIVHPVRVMNLVRGINKDNCVLAAALLHDVLEDTAITENQLSQFLSTLFNPADALRTLGYVVELTDVYTKESYPQFNRRTRKEKELTRLRQISPESQLIKYADIVDNAQQIAMHDSNFAGVLLREYRNMLIQLDKGAPSLRQKALAVINAEIKQLRGK